MAYFFDSAGRTPHEVLPGINARTFWGERMLLSLFDLAPGAVIPPHSHPHEQVGMVLSGEMEMTVENETRHIAAGDVYIIPGGTQHSVRVFGAPVQALETFSPVREEYKFPD